MTPGSRPVGEDELHAFVDGHLDPERRLQLERYLAENPAVAARVAGWQANHASLRAAMAPLGQQPIPARMDVRRLAANRAARRWSKPMAVASLAARSDRRSSVVGEVGPPESGAFYPPARHT